MNQPVRGKWKRRLRWAALFLMVSTIVAVAVAAQRLHFSSQLSPLLARLQWNHQETETLDRVRPDVIGHRGSARFFDFGVAVGNTGQAIQDGVDGGADWIEIDIRVTSDHELVVFHDETIDQKTNGQGRVSDNSLKDLASVDVLITPKDRILTLNQVFQRFNNANLKWVLDVKDKNAHQFLVPWLDSKILAGTLSRDQVVIIGEFEIVTSYAGNDFDLGYTLLFSGQGNLFRVLQGPAKIIERCRTAGIEILVLPILFASQSLVDAARSEGLRVWVYGSENEADLRYAAARGINGLIVDNPSKAIEIINN